MVIADRVTNEAIRLLSLLEESDRTWAIQYLLSRFAKSGGVLGNFTLII
ncbi:hypothetical protein [Nostoc sp. CCY0012]